MIINLFSFENSNLEPKTLGVLGLSFLRNLLNSIRNLEYRGYDSCGVAVIQKGKIDLRKNIGGIDDVNLKERLDQMQGKIGIAHTRWATHGSVTQENAHPHLSANREFAVVHNFEHLSFFISGILFWWPVIGLSIGAKKISIPMRIVYLLLAVTPTAVVAAFITLSDSVIYGDDIPRLLNISAIEDQKIGGLIMWIPGNTIFIATLTVLFFKWSYKQSKESRKYKG